ncbi:MAG: hypothetical protein KatS3mg126_1731 [Lysobacteraceae bacterium]|nr:MAG: hypothetical protein KatS3mg126_1731 [Xanthomonadaceae bacterium]
MSRCLFPAFLLLAGASLPVAAIEGHAYRGLATLPGGGAQVYLEDHVVRLEGGRLLERRVLYRCPDGTAFARKTVRYADPAWAPSFELEDVRFGYREGFARGKLTGSVWYRRRADQAEERDAVPLGESLVVDAGFDEFVRAKWDALASGQALPLRFLIPSRLAVWGFRLRQTGRSERYGEAARDFRLAVSGLLGWFADPIEVSYRERDRRLMRFSGMSNLRRSPEENFVVEIVFPPELEHSLTQAEWDAALATPLSPCEPGG